MSPISLPKRLSLIASLVPEHTYVADIGSDHALLPIYLVESGRIERAIAADIAQGPLQSARKNISQHSLLSKIDIVLSDGLLNVSELCPQTVIIAGMGGETITDILSACDYAKTSEPLLILQPMTHSEVLRRFLFENSFSITYETVVREAHRYYVIISAQHTKTAKHYFEFNGENFDVYCSLGGIMPNSEDTKSYLLWKKETTERALGGIIKSKEPNSEKEKLSNLICEIDRRLSL